MKNNINLDDYFSEAANQKELISKTELRNLVENAALPASVSIKNKFKLIKGSKYMNFFLTTAAAAAAVGLIGLGVSRYSGFTDESARQDNKITKQEINIGSESPENGNSGDEKNIREVIVPKTDNREANATRLDSKINIKGANVIELDDEELESLGIKKEGNESIEFRASKSSDGELFVYLTKSTISMSNKAQTIYILHPNSSSGTMTIAQSDKDKILTPKFVTDEFGSKRLSFLSGNVLGSWVSAKFVKDDSSTDGKSKTMEIKKAVVLTDGKFKCDNHENTGTVKVTIDPDASANLKKKMKIISKINISGIPDADIALPDVDSLINNSLVNIKISDSILNLSQKYLCDSLPVRLKVLGKNLKLLNKRLNSTITIESDEKYTDNNPHNINMNIELDELPEIPDAELEDPLSLNSNDGFLVLSDTLDCLTILGDTLNSLSLLGDTLNCLSLPDIKNLQNLYLKEGTLDEFRVFDENENDEFENYENSEDSEFNFDFNFNSDENLKYHGIETQLQDIKIKLNNIESEVNNYVFVNKMVPIGIRLDKKKPEGQYDYILWFEPNDILLEKLPPRVRAKLEPEIKALQNNRFCDKPVASENDAVFDIWRSCNGAIEKLQVYPNPSKGILNIKYNLNDDRNLTIILNDLTGRKICELSPMQLHRAGSNDESYELKDIEPGMYFISVQSDAGEQAVQRIIFEK